MGDAVRDYVVDGDYSMNGARMLSDYENQLAGSGEQPATAVAWGEISERSKALPAFPVDALPDKAAAFCAAVAEAYQVPASMVVCFLLGVASAAVVGRVSVQPKRKEPAYIEPAQLYLLCQGASGERKTPVLNVLKAPLEELLDKRRRAIQQENRAIEREIAAYNKDIARTRNHAEMVALQEKRDRLEEGKRPEPEYIQADVTTESIVLSMDEHEGRAIVLHDEADFLNVLTGKSYSKEGQAVNLSAILNGYNNSSVHGKRINRGEWHIKRASLAICLGVQPGLLRSFMANSSGQDRGLHGRFLYFLPKSRIGTRKSEATPVPSALSEWWAGAVDRLAVLNIDALPFDAYAEEAYRSWYDSIEPRLDGDLGGPLQAWAGKLCGNMVRLAGILALLDGQETVLRRHWDAAQAIAEGYFIPHARAAFGGEDYMLTDDARALLPKLRKQPSFKQSEFWQKQGRYILGNECKEAYEAALGVLCQRGYIRLAVQQTEGCAAGGRKPSPVWEVNPALLDNPQPVLYSEVEF